MENPAATTKTITTETLLVGSGWRALLFGDAQSCRTPGECEWRGGGGRGAGRGVEGNGWAHLFDQVSCLARCTHSVVIAMADARLWRAIARSNRKYFVLGD